MEEDTTLTITSICNFFHSSKWDSIVQAQILCWMVDHSIKPDSNSILIDIAQYRIQ